MEEKITDFSFIGDKNEIKKQIVDLVLQKKDFDAYDLFVLNDVLFEDQESKELEDFIVETNMEKDYIIKMEEPQYERSL